MVVILLGPPGVGKGTQAVRLADDIGGAHVSTGDLLRAARREGTPLGQKAQGYMDAGEYVPDDLILDLVREHLDTIPPDSTVLFDGFPRTIPQASGLESVLASIDRRVDAVVLLEAADEILVQRLSGRRSCPDCGAVYNTFFSPPSAEGSCDRCGGELVHRADDAPETVTRRLAIYHEQTAPLVSFYDDHAARVERVSADRGVDDVYVNFRSAVVGAA